MISSRFIVYTSLLLLALIYGGIKFRSLDRPYRLLTIYFGVVLLNEILGKFVGITYGNNHIFIHLLIPIQICFYALFYLALYPSTNRIRKWICWVGLFIFLLCLTNTFFIQSISSIPSNGIILLALYVVPLSLNDYKDMLERSYHVSLVRHSMFWFNLGNLIFYCLTFLIFSYFNVKNTVPTWTLITVWGANMFMYGFYFLSIYLNASKNNNGQL